jgi:hypothetical protein
MHRKIKLKGVSQIQLRLLRDCGEEVNELEKRLKSIFTGLPFQGASTVNKMLKISQVTVRLEIVRQQ